MACNQTIAGLIRGCDAAMGGVKEILLAQYTPKAFTVSANTVTGISSGITWYKYEIRKNTASFTSTLNIDDANGVNYVSTELSLVFTKMEAAKRAEMAALVLGDFMAIVTDANGTSWALGMDNPMIATSATGESGVAKSDGNKYTLVLSDESLSWPYSISADLPTPSND